MLPIIVVLALGLGLTSCTFAITLVVTTTTDAPDVNPGDGICEATPTTGDCTLRAAIEEANALGAASVSVPANHYPLNGEPLAITGLVALNVGDAQAVSFGDAVAPGTDVALVVEEGGSFQGEGVDIHGEVVVDGALALFRATVSALAGLGGDASRAMSVGTTGVAVLDNTIVTSWLSDGIVNRGLVVARHLTAYTVGGAVGDAALATEGAGSTILASSLITADEFHFIGPAPACSGTPPASIGYNGAADASCALSSVGDATTSPWNRDGASAVPESDSPALDAIPTGVNGCGTDVTVDRTGAPRPVDYDGDTIAACDMGALEPPAP